jgi:peptide/nickel transport system substrate-binding protein
MNLNKHSAIQYILASSLVGAIALSTYLFASRNRANTRTYVKPLANRVESIDPIKTRDEAEFMISRAIFGQLLKLDSFGDVQPGIVSSWRNSNDGKSYWLTMSSDVFFHNGTKASSRDLAFSIEYMAQKDSLTAHYFSDIIGAAEYQNGKSKGISGLKIVDSQTVHIELTEPSFVFLSILADPKVVLVPFHLMDKSRNEFFQNPVGAGPYRWVEGSTDGKIELKRTQTSANNQKSIESIIFETMTKEEAIKKLKAGTVQDLEAYQLRLSEAKSLADYAKVFSVSSSGVTHVFYNTKRPEFSNLSLRKVVAQSANKIDFVTKCDLSVGRSIGIIPDGYMGSLVQGRYSDFALQDLELDEAKKLLRAMGRAVEIYSYGAQFDKCVVSELANQLKFETGVEFTFKSVNYKEAVRKFVEKDFDLFVETLSIRGREPFSLLSFFDPGSNHNLTGFEDPLIKELIDKIRREPTRKARSYLYQELNELIAIKRVYSVPLFSLIPVGVFTKDVSTRTNPMAFLGNSGFESIEWE